MFDHCVALSLSKGGLVEDADRLNGRASTSSARRGLLLAVSVLSPTIAHAQAINCRVPDRLVAPQTRIEASKPVTPTGNLLALSWSPQFCRDKRTRPEHREQCGGANGRFGFILHGLWPDAAGRNDPAFCAPVAAVPPSVLKRHFCMIPSARLMQHEWAKHGSCGAPTPEAYFSDAARLFGALRWPDMNALSRKPLTVRQFSLAFARANRGLPESAISVQTARGGWLKEVRLCLDSRMRYRACPPEDRGASPVQSLRIWRSE